MSREMDPNKDPSLLRSGADTPARPNMAGVRDFTHTRGASPQIGNRNSRKSTNIEGLNLRIVEFLQEDGRATFSSIADKLGVSESTVRSRVARMREQNMIHFITVTNPLALGHSSWAMLGISVGQGSSATEVAEYFRELDEVVYAMRIAGRFDLLVEVVVDTPISLRDFLDKHCYESRLVSSVEPMMGLGLYKSLYKWELPIIEN
jgi:Lrp/AsnC family transcriptional regulator for asnA, asnC and gidA